MWRYQIFFRVHTVFKSAMNANVSDINLVITEKNWRLQLNIIYATGLYLQKTKLKLLASSENTRNLQKCLNWPTSYRKTCICYILTKSVAGNSGEDTFHYKTDLTVAIITLSLIMDLMIEKHVECNVPSSVIIIIQN